MIITVPDPVRPYADLSDLTTVPIASRGWRSADGISAQEARPNYVIDFSGNISPAEEAAVRRRLGTVDANEEALFSQGAAALATDRNFRDVIVPQLLAGANANATTAQLAQAVRTLTNQVDSLTRQNIGLIRLAQRLLDGTD